MKKLAIILVLSLFARTVGAQITFNTTPVITNLPRLGASVGQWAYFGTGAGVLQNVLGNPGFEQSEFGRVVPAPATGLTSSTFCDTNNFAEFAPAAYAGTTFQDDYVPGSGPTAAGLTQGTGTITSYDPSGVSPACGVITSSVSSWAGSSGTTYVVALSSGNANIPYQGSGQYNRGLWVTVSGASPAGCNGQFQLTAWTSTSAFSIFNANSGLTCTGGSVQAGTGPSYGYTAGFTISSGDFVKMHATGNTNSKADSYAAIVESWWTHATNLTTVTDSATPGDGVQAVDFALNGSSNTIFSGFDTLTGYTQPGGASQNSLLVRGSWTASVYVKCISCSSDATLTVQVTRGATTFVSTTTDVHLTTAWQQLVFPFTGTETSLTSNVNNGNLNLTVAGTSGDIRLDNAFLGPTPLPPAATTNFIVLPPKSSLPSGSACATWASAIAFAENGPWNHDDGSPAHYNSELPPTSIPSYFYANAGPLPLVDYAAVDGNFTGNTEQTYAWAACKWGIDIDMIRAQAEAETAWHQDCSILHGGSTCNEQGDCNNPYNCISFPTSCVDPNGDPTGLPVTSITPGGIFSAFNNLAASTGCSTPPTGSGATHWNSWGVLQDKVYYRWYLWPMVKDSLPFAVDFREASTRGCINGDQFSYFNSQSSASGTDYQNAVNAATSAPNGINSEWSGHTTTALKYLELGCVASHFYGSWQGASGAFTDPSNYLGPIWTNLTAHSWPGGLTGVINGLSPIPTSAGLICAPWSNDYVNALRLLNLGSLRSWQSDNANSFANMTADQYARGSTNVVGSNDVEWDYGLDDFLHLAQCINAIPWVNIPIPLNDTELGQLGAYLKTEQTKYNFREIDIEFGDEQWNGGSSGGVTTSPSGDIYTAFDGREIPVINTGYGTGSSILKFVVGGQYGSPPGTGIGLGPATATTTYPGLFTYATAAPYYWFCDNTGKSSQTYITDALTGDNNITQAGLSGAFGSISGLIPAEYEAGPSSWWGTMTNTERNQIIAGFPVAMIDGVLALNSWTAGVPIINDWNLTQQNSTKTVAWSFSSLCSNTDAPPGGFQAYEWGVLKDIYTPLLRPRGLALSLINKYFIDSTSGSFYQTASNSYGASSIQAGLWTDGTQGCNVLLANQTGSAVQVQLTLPTLCPNLPGGFTERVNFSSAITDENEASAAVTNGVGGGVTKNGGQNITVPVPADSLVVAYVHPAPAAVTPIYAVDVSPQFATAESDFRSSGAFFYVNMNQVEPTKGNFDWSTVDSEVAQVPTGKKFVLDLRGGDDTPSWVWLTDGAATNNIIWDQFALGPPAWPSLCSVVTIPVPWDPVTIADFKLVIDAMATRYASNPNLAQVVAGGFNTITDEAFIYSLHPSVQPIRDSGGVQVCVSYNDILNWNTAGYTQAVAETAWKSYVNEWAAQFPSPTVLIGEYLVNGFPADTGFAQHFGLVERAFDVDARAITGRWQSQNNSWKFNLVLRDADGFQEGGIAGAALTAWTVQLLEEVGPPKTWEFFDADMTNPANKNAVDLAYVYKPVKQGGGP